MSLNNKFRTKFRAISRLIWPLITCVHREPDQKPYLFYQKNNFRNRTRYNYGVYSSYVFFYSEPLYIRFRQFHFKRIRVIFIRVFLWYSDKYNIFFDKILQKKKKIMFFKRFYHQMYTVDCAVPHVYIFTIE